MTTTTYTTLLSYISLSYPYINHAAHTNCLINIKCQVHYTTLKSWIFALHTHKNVGTCACRNKEVAPHLRNRYRLKYKYYVLMSGPHNLWLVYCPVVVSSWKYLFRHVPDEAFNLLPGLQGGWESAPSTFQTFISDGVTVDFFSNLILRKGNEFSVSGLVFIGSLESLAWVKNEKLFQLKTGHVLIIRRLKTHVSAWLLQTFSELPLIYC